MIGERITAEYEYAVGPATYVMQEKLGEATAQRLYRAHPESAWQSTPEAAASAAAALRKLAAAGRK